MANPIALQSLSTREAIIDVIYRFHAGFDQADRALFDSVWTPDATLDLHGRVLTGLDAIRAGSYDRISKLDTTHLASNIRVDVKDGSSTASMTASAMGQHFRAGEGEKEGTTQFLAGGVYHIDLVRDGKDGLWKAKYWKLNRLWNQGDMAVVTGA